MPNERYILPVVQTVFLLIYFSHSSDQPALSLFDVTKKGRKEGRKKGGREGEEKKRREMKRKKKGKEKK